MSMKKIFWTQLNPLERLDRYIHTLWLLVLAVMVLFLRVEFMMALFLSGVLIFTAYLEYKSIKKKALEFEKQNKG